MGELFFPHQVGKNLGEVSDWSLVGQMTLPAPITVTRRGGALIGHSGIMCSLPAVGGVSSRQVSDGAGAWLSRCGFAHLVSLGWGGGMQGPGGSPPLLLLIHIVPGQDV